MIYLVEYPDRRAINEDAFTATIKNPCIDPTIIRKPIWCPVDFVDPGIETIFMPDWMKVLQDQRVVVGGDNLGYYMGVPVNVYGAPMTVSISGGFADTFIRYDILFNTF